MAQIIIRLKDRELRRAPITAMATRIGRDTTNDVVITNDSISRHHATLRYEPAEGAFVIYDESQNNGLFVRGRTTPSARLGDGDEVMLGKFTLVFLVSGGAPLDALRPEEPAEPAPSTQRPRNPLPTVAVPAARTRPFSAPPGALSPRHEPAPEPASDEATHASDEEAPSDTSMLQTKLMRQLVWLLAALVAVLTALLVVLMLRR